MLVEAATRLSEALRGYPVEGPPKGREMLAERIEDVRGRLAVIELDVEPAQACLVIGGREAGCGRHDFELYAAPGRIVIEATAVRHRPGTVVIERALPGSHHELRLSLEPESGPAPPPPAPAPALDQAGADAPASFPAWPAVLAGASAAVALGIGIGLRLAGEGALDSADELRDEMRGAPGTHCPAPDSAELQARCDELGSRYGTVDDYRNSSTGLFIAGGLCAAGTAVLTALYLADRAGDDEPPEPAQAGLHVAPLLTPGGSAGIGLWGSW
jgi:hypothetical protein